ncbi:DUF2971 domain-containing protein [Bdellovibrio sp. HCB290]|uniref:DUF2971 domain-containing protein n=1 Tax=Bdellovibrio sp. HCB290 TaxID=3394356 RepID=UPI0039B66AFA
MSPADSLGRIFFPHTVKEFVAKEKADIVHYTSAETALKIIQSKTFWFRDCRVMNDTSEILHGKKCLLDFLASKQGQQFIDAMNSVHSGCSFQLIPYIKFLLESNSEEVFIASFYIQKQETNPNGRLSMWKAYGGGKASVALHFSPDYFFREGTESIAMVVQYQTAEQFTNALLQKAEEVRNSSKLFSAMSIQDFVQHIGLYLLFTVLSTKHNIFEEEQELRVVLPRWIGNTLFVPTPICIDGIPQTVRVLDLNKYMTTPPHYADTHKLFKEVVVGPSGQQKIIKRALELAIYENATIVHSKVRCVDVPLRT